MLYTDNLEIRRLRQDLILVYKILFGLIDVNTEDLLTLGITLEVTVINYMYVHYDRIDIRKHVFSERIVLVWNSLLPLS